MVLFQDHYILQKEITEEVFGIWYLNFLIEKTGFELKPLKATFPTQFLVSQRNSIKISNR